MRVFTFIGEKLLNVAQGLGEMLAGWRQEVVDFEATLDGILLYR